MLKISFRSTISGKIRTIKLYDQRCTISIDGHQCNAIKGYDGKLYMEPALGASVSGLYLVGSYIHPHFINAKTEKVVQDSQLKRRLKARYNCEWRPMPDQPTIFDRPIYLGRILQLERE